MSSKQVLRAGLGASTFTAIVAAGVLAAPFANASGVVSVAVSGTNCYVSTAYTVTATLNLSNATGYNNDTVSFTDNGTAIGSAAPTASGTATITWTPQTTGTHTILASQWSDGGPISSSINVTVTTAPPTPPASSGSASGIPFIGGLLNSLSAN